MLSWPPAPVQPCSHLGPFFPTGDLLIIMAQIIVAIQMVLEEKFVYKHNVHPLRAVGTEGVCGHRGLEGVGWKGAWGAEPGFTWEGVNFLPPIAF